MKKFISAISLAALLATSTFGSVYVEYYNRDSETHVFEAKDGSQKRKVEFRGSVTSAETIQCGPSETIIYTKCGEVKVKHGDKIEIKDGCIKVK